MSKYNNILPLKFSVLIISLHLILLLCPRDDDNACLLLDGYVYYVLFIAAGMRFHWLLSAYYTAWARGCVYLQCADTESEDWLNVINSMDM